MKLYNGYRNKNKYFEGWYFKQNNNQLNISFIPSISVTNQIKKCFVQVITEQFTHTFEFPFNKFQFDQSTSTIKIDNNTFNLSEINVDLNDNQYHIKANLKYEDLTFLKFNIMGIFNYFPLMECKHSIISMRHLVSGNLYINEKEYKFNKDLGYIEKDYGKSFPTTYTWIQCNSFLEDESLFFSMAKIPYLGFKFNGFICSFIVHDKEYRFATYNFSKLLQKEKNHIQLKKMDLILDIYYNQKNPLKLLAPTSGKMNRNIRECINGVCFVRLAQKGKVIFESMGKPASIEIIESYTK